MATMRDVATRAGVSKQTVSNVLNGRDRSPFVTPQTRERILRAIAELDYHPDSNARGLRNGRTRTLGFIVVDESPAFLSDLFHSEVASGIAEAVRASDQWLLIHGLAPGETTAARLLQPFLQRRIDGAVVTLSGPLEIRAACLRGLVAGAMRAVKARGRRVPDDVAVIGFDDFEFAAYLEPPLTTIKLAGLEMGRKAAQMLLHYTAEGGFAEKEVTFPATLVARASA